MDNSVLNDTINAREPLGVDPKELFSDSMGRDTKNFMSDDKVMRKSMTTAERRVVGALNLANIQTTSLDLNNRVTVVSQKTVAYLLGSNHFG